MWVIIDCFHRQGSTNRHASGRRPTNPDEKNWPYGIGVRPTARAVVYVVRLALYCAGMFCDIAMSAGESAQSAIVNNGDQSQRSNPDPSS